MPTSSHDGSAIGDGRGQLSASISRAVVRLFSEHTGRGPTKARGQPSTRTSSWCSCTTALTHAEQTLAQAGKEAEVLRIRRNFQETMRPSLVAAIEGLTERNVVTFMSADAIDPDAAAEIFVMDRAV